jgi:UTP:GlnB (protein PII) uridylyltransferase
MIRQYSVGLKKEHNDLLIKAQKKISEEMGFEVARAQAVAILASRYIKG